MSEAEIARKYNFSSVYFPVMKRTNRDKYDCIFSFNKDKYTSVMMYIEYVRDIIFRIQDLLLRNTDSKAKLGRFATEMTNGYQKKNPTQVYACIEDVVMSFRDDSDFIRINFSVVNKLNKLLRSQYE